MCGMELLLHEAKLELFSLEKMTVGIEAWLRSKEV